MSRRDSEREVEGSGGGRSPMTRGTRRGAKRKERRVLDKDGKENIRRGNKYVHKQLNVQEKLVSASEGRWRGVAHDVHDMRLTGAMVAQTCGAHQGAEVTSAWFEASGDLQSANEERGEMRDEDEGRGEGWGWSEDEGELVALSSRAAVALDARAVCARGLALWVTRSDSELNARTTLTTDTYI